MGGDEVQGILVRPASDKEDRDGGKQAPHTWEGSLATKAGHVHIENHQVRLAKDCVLS